MDKNFLYDRVESAAQIIRDVSDKIWEYAEISMEETRSAALYKKVLGELGFTVEDKVAGIPTAFSGSYGSGRPVIGILAEYDALSGLSQAANVTVKDSLVPEGNGHGCGHNLLGAGSLGAAIAIKEAIKAGILKGTVVFYGCPGEEGCAGKTFMARDGVFRDLDAALCWHPGDVNEVTTGTCAACLQYEYTFTGISAHAAGDPENGRSALDGAELMNIGVQFLREHMSKKASVHYAFSNTGGLSPNVVQSQAKLIYMIREANVSKAKKLLQRVHNIAKGAALMTGTSVSWKQIDGTSNTVSNSVMEKILYENMACAPLPTYSQDEWEYANALKSTYSAETLPGQNTEVSHGLWLQVKEKSDNGKRALNDFLLQYVPSNTFTPGSTDVGDVSWLTPTAQFTAVTWTSGSPGHSWQNVAIGKSSIAHKGALYAAKVMAGAAADMIEKSDLLMEIRKEFEAFVGSYDCPLEDDLKVPE